LTLDGIGQNEWYQMKECQQIYQQKFAAYRFLLSPDVARKNYISCLISISYLDIDAGCCTTLPDL
jgi:hypothetical protein